MFRNECIYIKKILLIVFTMLSTFQAFEERNLKSYAAPLVMTGDNGVNENFR